MLILEESIVILTCIIVVLWLRVSHHQKQQALLWWYGRQWMRMYKEGEAIRNGLLQESFIIRRHLELSLTNHAESQQKQNQYYLETIEKFHHSLKELSEYLSPAYIEDSYPLAIQYLLESWKSRIPGLKLELELPANSHHESYQDNRVILMALEELLQIMLSEIPNSLSIFVSLKSRGHLNELMVQFTMPHVSKTTDNFPQADLDYLRHAVKFLTFGECFYSRKNHTETWYFRWRCARTQ